MNRELVGEYGVFQVHRSRARSPRTSEVLEFHVLHLPDWVNVVPITDDGKLVMVEQFRHGRGEIVLEFPSGMMDGGESAAAAGLRELEEETGFRSTDCRVLGAVEPNPALQGNRMHVVLATGCMPEGRRRQDQGEDVHVRLVEPSELREWLASGRVSHALVMAAWFLYEADLRGKRR